MCGISGHLTRGERPDRDVVERQLRLLDHRGPDASGMFAGEEAVIAQNRLSIIDVVTGDPPITNETGTLGVVLNGELYDFRRLRDELGRRGHRFATHGDTEVIAHLLEDHAPVEAARRLDGMFAFAALDRESGRLVLARDRMGKKPLYYWWDGASFVFASEIKSVLAHPAVRAELDPRAIPAYLAFGYVPTPHTFFAGIRSLPPACVLLLEAGGQPVVQRYWEPEPSSAEAQPVARDLPTAARQVRELLTDAVERRLVADVPLGAFLSGGVDSSAIVGIMAGLSDRPVSTFTIGFDDRDGFDERPFARAVAERHGTDHHEHVVHPNAVDLVERLVWHHDQPFGDSSAVPTFLLAEATRRDVTVALSGDGGDELYAGYERLQAAVLADRLGRLPQPVRVLSGRVAEAVPDAAAGGRGVRAKRFARNAHLGMPGALRNWVSFIDPETQAALAPRGSRWGFADYDERWARTAGAGALDRVLELNRETYLLDDLLVKADRMSMAHGLEVRSPFLDRALLEHAIRLRPHLKARGTQLKRVLKHAVADLLPPAIIARPKRGFGVPLDRWFREDLGSYVDSRLGAADARVRSHLDGATIDRLLSEHRLGQRQHGHVLWTLLTLEVFLREQGW